MFTPGTFVFSVTTKGLFSKDHYSILDPKRPQIEDLISYRFPSDSYLNYRKLPDTLAGLALLRAPWIGKSWMWMSFDLSYILIPTFSMTWKRTTPFLYDYFLMMNKFAPSVKRIQGDNEYVEVTEIIASYRHTGSRYLQINRKAPQPAFTYSSTPQ